MKPTITDQFKNALRHFASGVTIVTLRSGDRVHGLTVSAFSSLSAEPPLIAVVINQGNHAHSLLEEEGSVFAVNILGHDQQELSDRFAWLKDGDRFAEGSWQTASTGAPILTDALVWLDCTIHDRVDAGTHTIYVGRVRAAGVPRPDEAPLVYWNRGYRQIAEPADLPLARSA
jgi:flavin reductase (DIM6/NTAB) family NADH-FMN oxidoreductase RutF